MRRVYKKILFCLGLSILLISKVSAASVSVSGANVTQGDTFSVKVTFNGGGTTVGGFGGSIQYDSSYLGFNGCTKGGALDGGSVNGTTIGLYDNDQEGLPSSGTLLNCSFTANKQGSTSIKIKNAVLNGPDTNELPVSSNAGTINIAAPKSRNANLNSLSVSGCSIGFSASNTNYSCTVESNVTSVNVSASAQDGGASVSGTGNKSLNFGNNKISVTVKAPAGNTQTYTVNVTRKDNRSGENSLSSLSVSNGKLSPEFNSNTTNYSIEVPYSETSLNIKYNAKDSKAQVKVNNNNLEAEATTNVTITVTAENGSTKTYTIAAKRGKDPNKVLNTDNNLASLTIDTGILSPAFSKDNTNYVVYLPYEVSKINISYEVSDTRYGQVNLNGPETLGVGNNVYNISVKAEDESEKVYTVTVVRAKVVNGESSNNALLASLTMDHATLTEKFDSGVHLYYYNASSSKDIQVSAIAQDPEAVVTYLEAGAGVYAVLVTAPSGNMSIYIMLATKNMGTIIAVICVVALALLVGIFIIVKKIRSKSKDGKEDKKKDKKNKKHKKDSEE